MSKLNFKLIAKSIIAVTLFPIAANSAGITPQRMADAIYSVIESDRTVYTRNVVNRLQNEDEVLEATEHWKEEQTLPLPAQMLRMGSERTMEKKSGFTYSLLSLWPINQQNKAKTQMETDGLQKVQKTPNENYYGTEELGGKKYFTAVYADIATSPACVTCHNEHMDSPKDDFKLGDVMGGIVIRIPLD